MYPIGIFIQRNFPLKVIIENKNIEFYDASDAFISSLRERLSYKDKKVEYALRRMGKNKFSRGTPYYKELQKKLYGTLVKTEGDMIVIPSGFAHFIPDYANTIDKRSDTGEDISLPWKNKPFDPRPYQDEALDLMLDNYRGLINFATGLGKTLTAVHAIRRHKKRTLVLCPGTGIADNFYEELVNAFGESKVGYFGDGKKKIKDITVGIAQSVNNHIQKFKDADLGMIIVDEVHHLPADTFFSITDELGDVGRIFGLTATDFRSDGKDLMITAGAGPTLIKRDLVWGIKHGWLAKPYIIMRNVETYGREYKEDLNKNYKQHAMNSQEMTERIISDAQKFLDAGKTVLLLVKEIPHGEEIANALGLKFATGKDKKSNGYIKELNAGKIPGLVGTASKIGEGVDTKRVDVLSLANFVASKGPLWQNLGRGLRLYDGKEGVIVLDYCPTGSKMMTRHAEQRLKFYNEITADVRVIDG